MGLMDQTASRPTLISTAKMATEQVRIVSRNIEGNAVLSIGSGATVWSATFMDTFEACVRRVGNWR